MEKSGKESENREIVCTNDRRRIKDRKPRNSIRKLGEEARILRKGMRILEKKKNNSVRAFSLTSVVAIKSLDRCKEAIPNLSYTPFSLRLYQILLLLLQSLSFLYKTPILFLYFPILWLFKIHHHLISFSEFQGCSLFNHPLKKHILMDNMKNEEINDQKIKNTNLY